jgi:hypothetical protein
MLTRTTLPLDEMVDLLRAAGEPTRKAVDEVIGFFRAKLG